MSIPIGELIILGTSAGWASAYRASSSYLFDLGDEGILIDCGDGATRNFLHAGYRPEWVRHIVISHTHADHFCGLPYFVQQRFLSGTDAPLTIRCPGDAAKPIRAIFDLGYLFAERLPFTIDFQPLSVGEELQIGEAAITPYPTTHLAAMRSVAEQYGYANRGECFALRIVVGNTTVLYSADLGSLHDLDDIPTPIDWLLVDSAHIHIDQLWSWAEERRIRKIIFTHLKDDFDVSVIANVPKQMTAEPIIAEDGMRLSLT